MTAKLTPAAAVPVTDVTPELLRYAARVHAFDPARPGFDAWIPITPFDQGGADLNVLIDYAHKDEQLGRLRDLIRLARIR
ncbi:hypothetical protein J0H58_23740 [bacterium]|nr:hypothetical protein [bacterium]